MRERKVEVVGERIKALDDDNPAKPIASNALCG